MNRRTDVLTARDVDEFGDRFVQKMVALMRAEFRRQTRILIIANSIAIFAAGCIGFIAGSLG